MARCTPVIDFLSIRSPGGRLIGLVNRSCVYASRHGEGACSPTHCLSAAYSHQASLRVKQPPEAEKRGVHTITVAVTLLAYTGFRYLVTPPAEPSAASPLTGPRHIQGLMLHCCTRKHGLCTQISGQRTQDAGGCTRNSGWAHRIPVVVHVTTAAKWVDVTAHQTRTWTLNVCVQRIPVSVHKFPVIRIRPQDFA